MQFWPPIRKAVMFLSCKIHAVVALQRLCTYKMQHLHVIDWWRRIKVQVITLVPLCFLVTYRIANCGLFHRYTMLLSFGQSYAPVHRPLPLRWSFRHLRKIEFRQVWHFSDSGWWTLGISFRLIFSRVSTKQSDSFLPCRYWRDQCA